MFSYSTALLGVLILVMFCESDTNARGHITFRDLTHKLQPGIPVYPGLSNYTVIPILGTVQNVTFTVEDISTTTHIGTHVDAPSHFCNGTWHVDEIPLHRFLAPAAVIDIRYKTLKNSDAELTVNDLVTWELNYGQIPDGAAILVLTGWDRYWKNNTRYLGIKGDRPRSVPGFSEESAKWIVSNTKAHAVGIDTISIDSGDNIKSHLVLCRYLLYNIENLKDLDKLPPTGATIHVMPTKIKSGSGAPARVIAMCPS